jgi:hypothetical protein
VEVFSVAAVELGDDEEDEGERDVLEEVAVAAGGDLEVGSFRFLIEVGSCLGAGLGSVLICCIALNAKMLL